MSHNDYVRPSGQWLSGFVFTPNDFRRLDVAQFQGVDGDVGGIWNPSSPIAIGGSGLQLVDQNHDIGGGVITRDGGRVVLGHNDYPTFEVDAVRSVKVDLVGGYWTIFFFGLQNATSSLTSVGTVFNYPGVIDALFLFRRRDMHRGGALESAVITFRVGLPHYAVPAGLLQVILTRSDWFPLYYLAATWAPSFNVSVLQTYVVPTVPNGRVYAPTGTGSAGSTEPAWPTTPGATTAPDGAITWVCTGIGPAPQWLPSHAYAFEAVAQPASHNGASANGLVYVVLTAGTSGAGTPAWDTATIPGATFIDGTVEWACLGIPGPFGWVASTAYVIGQLVTTGLTDGTAGMIFQCARTGTSGPVPPAWNTTLETPDNTTKWDFVGSMMIGQATLSSPASGAAYYAANAAQTLEVPCNGGGPNVIASDLYSYVIAITDESGIGAYQVNPPNSWQPGQGVGVDVIVAAVPPNGYSYVVTAVTSGVTGGAPPTWPLNPGDSVVDNGVTWTNQGPIGASLNVYHSAVLNFGGIADMRPE